MIVEISQEEANELTDRIAKFLVERKMAAPAIMGIESLKPLNFLGSQVMYFVGPFAELIFNADEYQRFAALIEKDEYIEMLLKKIERLDHEMYWEEREQARVMRKRRMNRIKKFFKKIFSK